MDSGYLTLERPLGGLVLITTRIWTGTMIYDNPNIVV